MLGFILLIAFLFCGVVLCDALLRKKSGLIRLWTGMAAGLIMMMWLPAMWAFGIGFTRTAQLLGLACAVGISGITAAARFSKKEKRGSFLGDMPPIMFLVLIIPFILLSGYLQYTHTLREVDGALHVGQSTYGDLCLHLGIATSLQNASFPPEYSILPGTLLGYPFLSDSLVTTMLLFGSPLAPSFAVTGTLMMLLVGTGFIVFAWELTHRRAAVVLSFLLMFMNGGLGFLYILDGAFKDPTMLREVFTGFYKTPTNYVSLNLRWVNVICDMMVPQRTLLAGWCVLLPALYLLVCALRERRTSYYILLGVWAGLMPMIHTHSFFALGLSSIAIMLHSLLHAGTDRLKTLTRFLIYGGIAVLLALPQLMIWTFPQTVNGGSMRLIFNWVNNQGNGKLIDGYFWFWIKNVGLVYIIMVPAALHMPRGSWQRSLSLGALMIYTVAELVQFQPNLYDNNKLFYAAYMIMCPIAAVYLVHIWDRLRGVRGRALLAGAFICVSVLSGAMTIGREIVSDYTLFPAAEVQAADYVKENTPEHCTFLTGTQHNNAVAALTGRNIVCGTGSYLYYHGLDYGTQQNAVAQMFESPEENREMFELYGVEYVYISSYERANYAVDLDWFDENLSLLYDADGIRIYAVRTDSPQQSDILA